MTEKINNERLFFLIFLSILTILVYFNAINLKNFVFDEKSYLKDAPLYNSDVSFLDVLKSGYDGGQFLNRSDSIYYRPLVTLSFYLEKRLIGFEPESLRLTNVFLYFLGIIFLYLFLLRQKLQPYSAELLTLLFLIVPINVDNIVYIVGRYDIFMLLFGFLSLYFLDLGIEKNKNFFYFISLVFFILGMFSKETFLIWAAFFVAYEFLRRKKIKILYHLSTFSSVLLFFIIKNSILGFRNISFRGGENFFYYVKLLVLSVSVYFKTVVFPVLFPKNYSIADLSLKDLVVFAFLFVSFFSWVVIRSMRNRRLLPPLFLFVFSFAPYIYMVFTDYWPFKISTRYMMIPYFAFLWILFILFDKTSYKLKISIILIFMFLFVYSDLKSIRAYKSELNFWRDAYHYNPKNSYILYSLADVYYDKGDILSSEYYLKKALGFKLNKLTAYYSALLYAYIELKKADYKASLKWITNLKKLERMFYFPVFEKIKKLFFYGDYYSNKGDLINAERVLLKAKSINPEKMLIYEKLYNLYCGYELWSKALEIENEMKTKFPRYKNLNTKRRKEDFKLFNDKQKVLFYILNNNYMGAIKIITKKTDRSKTDDFILIESYLRLEDPMNYKKSIEAFIHKWGNNYRTYRELGYFFIKRMYRVKEAISFFEKSLKINPNQPTLRAFIKYLRSLGLE